VLVNRLEASREPEAGFVRLPLPTKKLFRYESPVEMLLSCMLWLSVGVYQRKLGGLVELAAALKVEVETEELAKTLALARVSAKLVKGKWSLPLGQPLSQYACQVRPAGANLSATRFAAVRSPQPSLTPYVYPANKPT